MYNSSNIKILDSSYFCYRERYRFRFWNEFDDGCNRIREFSDFWAVFSSMVDTAICLCLSTLKYSSRKLWNNNSVTLRTYHELEWIELALRRGDLRALQWCWNNDDQSIDNQISDDNNTIAVVRFWKLSNSKVNCWFYSFSEIPHWSYQKVYYS